MRRGVVQMESGQNRHGDDLWAFLPPKSQQPELPVCWNLDGKSAMPIDQEKQPVSQRCCS
ncbi:uncharacterized protein FTOL_13955 [Fusarium torulosum]|uniref:Uncharacterized protein n=1 Tax=Fusarium torulosum TaxID=33205 RepID=A0AAE8MNF4_9HYPO|nr:uncharacterized protein FTOL_13955 [Fusarium torulosum]